MECLDISANGEMICPLPDNPTPWFTEEIPYTGGIVDVSVILLIALIFIAVGMFVFIREWIKDQS